MKNVIVDRGRERMIMEMSLHGFEKARDAGLDELAIENLADVIVSAERLKL